jgi:hypothetical protein
MNRILYVLWPILIFFGGVALCYLKPSDLSWLKLGLSAVLVLGVTALIAAVLLPFRETSFISGNFYGAVVSATLSGGLMGLVLILLSKVLG